MPTNITLGVGGHRKRKHEKRKKFVTSVLVIPSRQGRSKHSPI